MAAIRFAKGKVARATLAAGVVGVVGAGTFLIGQTGSTASTTAATDDVLHLSAKRTQEKFIDVGASGPSVGDRQVFSENVYDRDGTRVGKTVATCDVAYVTKNSNGKVTNALMQCVGTIRLANGAITVQGPVSWSGKTSELAITGGTGHYNDAHGYFDIEDVSDTRSDYTLHVRDSSGGIIP